MNDQPATAIAHPNIAFIKYWGDQNRNLRIPVNGSISMNLAGLETRTCVRFDPALGADQLILNEQVVTDARMDRVSRFLDHVRHMAGMKHRAIVESNNNFPTGAGIASSASGFAALALAASRAAGLELDEPALSRLARKGSGSACRSIPAGFVEWLPGSTDQDSYARSIAPPEHWQLVDCVAVVHSGHKATGSTQGHALAATSPLQVARVQGAPLRLQQCRNAIQHCDFEALAAVVEQDSNMMHAVMMTSQPALFYWEPASLTVMKAVRRWRKHGCPVFYTLDAGPNVHVLTTADMAASISSRLARLDGVREVLTASAGGPAHLID